MNSPAFLALFSIIFILLGGYNVFSGLRRLRAAQASGIPSKWFKQINLLTGVEYILLALVFLLSSAVRNKTLPASLNGIIVPIYFVLLIAAAILAGLVIRQGIINARTLRAQSRSSSNSTTRSNGTSKAVGYAVEDDEDAEQRAASLERRRERRRNAAAARRRRAGKA